jgi:hypothetical protein
MITARQGEMQLITRHLSKEGISKSHIGALIYIAHGLDLVRRVKKDGYMHVFNPRHSHEHMIDEWAVVEILGPSYRSISLGHDSSSEHASREERRHREETDIMRLNSITLALAHLDDSEISEMLNDMPASLRTFFGGTISHTDAYHHLKTLAQKYPFLPSVGKCSFQNDLLIIWWEVKADANIQIGSS